MKGKILITAHYILEAERDEFWDIEKVRLLPLIDDCLHKAFPEEIEFSGELVADRYYIKHRIIDYPQYSLLNCPFCERALTNPANPGPIQELDIIYKNLRYGIPKRRFSCVQMCNIYREKLKNLFEIVVI